MAPIIRVLENPEHSYAICLPPDYTPARSWPVLYCFDPMARGALPVERFRAAADKLGYVVVGSNNSRNGPMENSLHAVEVLLRDTERRLNLDPGRKYAAGFSGGARLADLVARTHGFAGVVAVGAGFPGSVTPADLPHAFFGAVGREDLNYQEMRRLQRDLAGRPEPHRLAVFDGGHEWMPPAVAEQALEWMHLQAMRDGRLEADRDWIQATFARHWQAARALSPEGHAHEEGVELQADFRGLVNTTELDAWVAGLKGSKPVRRYLRTEQRDREEEERWTERLRAALHPPPPGAEAPEESGDRNPFPDRGALSDSPGGSFARGLGMPVEPRRPSWPSRREQNPAELLREVVDDMRSRWNRSAPVRRVLRGAGLSMRAAAEEKYGRGEWEEAGNLLELAAILEPAESWTYYRLAWVRLRQNRRNEAQAEMANATRRGFNDADRLRDLSRALTAHEQGKTVLEPMFITARPRFVTSFGIALLIHADPGTREMVRVVITGAAEGSEAEARGLGRGEEIVRINGRGIRSFQADFSKDGDFARLLAGRRRGERISLEILEKPGDDPREVTLTQGLTADEVVRPWLTEG